MIPGVDEDEGGIPNFRVTFGILPLPNPLLLVLERVTRDEDVVVILVILLPKDDESSLSSLLLFDEEDPDEDEGPFL